MTNSLEPDARLARRFEAALASIDDHIAIFDRDCRYTYVNSGAAQVLGRPAEALLGRRIWDLFPEAVGNQFYQELQRAIAERVTLRSEHYYEPFGRWFENAFYPFDDGVLVYSTDITARKQAEQALAMQVRVLDSMREGVSVSDEQGHIVYTNPAEDAMFGYEPGELVGKHVTIQNCYPPEENARIVAQVIEQLKAEGVWVGEWNNVRKDGSRFITRARITSLEVGDRRYWVCVQEDISERRRQEQAARFLASVSQELAASLDYETTLHSIARLAVPAFADWCVVDLLAEDGSIQPVVATHADPSLEPLLRDLQRYPTDLELPSRGRAIHTSRSVLIESVDETQLLQAAHDARHLEILRQLAPRSVLIAPLVARGRTIGTLLFAVSSAGQRYDAADQRLAEDLAGRCALAIDNARLYQEAREAIRVREEFLSVASHELRTPLTTLSAHAQYLLRSLARGDGLVRERIERSLLAITQQGDRLARLIGQLLDVSRLEAGRLALAIEPTPLWPLVESVVEAARVQTSHHTISIRGESSLLAAVDPLRLEQVLTNLLDNAIKYSPDGGPIDLELRRADGDRVELTVRDHGLGIPPEKRAQIFDRFFQAHADSHTSGMGLGLFISRQIVEQHGGELAVEFPDDGGTRFVLHLPECAGAD